MPDEVPFTADRVADLMEVLRTPEHQAGLEETTFTVVSVADRAAGLIRVSGTISGTHSLQDWAGPNIAVRLSLPERSSEFAGIDGAPDTTAPCLYRRRRGHREQDGRDRHRPSR